jgi:hypothetical protein
MIAQLSLAEVMERRKKEWLEAPASYFETDSFGELAVGDRFIWQPLPGDNHGHGGFKGTHSIFTKTVMDVAHTESGLPYGIPHGRAVVEDNGRKVSSDLPHSMSVIRVS